MTNRRRIESLADDIDRLVCDGLDIDDEVRAQVAQEIWLRTVEDPDDRVFPDPDTVDDRPAETEALVKKLVHHFVLRAVQRDEDGIVPVSAVGAEANLTERVQSEFERSFGEHASSRLTEADELLGDEPADAEAYPNLRAWLEDDFFDYHVSAFDRTPVLWRLTSERLVSDPRGEGFACLVDYQQLDDGLFDRLTNRYLEPRKALLRERRSAASRRRSDDSLSASEQAVAADEHAACESGLEQIAVFEERIADLAQPSSREWSAETRDRAASAVDRVAEFRERTADRIEILDELAASEDVDMAALFSPSFYETVEDSSEEWLAALSDLEAAFEAYAGDGDAPVAPHLYDLFEYYGDLVGSAHYASNGILFTTYYYDQFEDPDQSQLGDGGPNERRRLVSRLASDVEEYRHLAAEIGDACDALVTEIDSDWDARALSEITTAGYSPNAKHGVEINITPLARAEIVPKTVTDDVL